MKVRYQFASLTLEQQSHLKYMLLQEIETQGWYAIVFLRLWKTYGLICIQ